MVAEAFAEAAWATIASSSTAAVGRRQMMAKLIECQDGFLVRGASDDELVANAEAHLRDAHPELVGTLSRDQFLAMAREV
jgi:predicted small metal-binding protein